MWMIDENILDTPQREKTMHKSVSPKCVITAVFNRLSYW